MPIAVAVCTINKPAKISVANLAFNILCLKKFQKLCHNRSGTCAGKWKSQKHALGYVAFACKGNDAKVGSTWHHIMPVFLFLHVTSRHGKRQRHNMLKNPSFSRESLSISDTNSRINQGRIWLQLRVPANYLQNDETPKKQGF